MTKKTTQCLGMSRVQLEAIIEQAATGRDDLSLEDKEEVTPDTLVESGLLKRCSVHQGMYLTGTFGA